MVKMTMLNSMADGDFGKSLDKQRSWGIEVLDLKNGIFSKSLDQLTVQEAREARNEIDQRHMSVYCFSTTLFDDDIEKGETHFLEYHLFQLNHILRIADILQPTVIRLLAAKSSKRSLFKNSLDYMEQSHPWLLPMYREAVDRIHSAGFQATIENECHDCIFATPEEITGFFDRLDRRKQVYFTYDVQNLWQMGTYPSLDVIKQLKSYIGFYHLKGGQGAQPGAPLEWSSSLEDATWPVREMTQYVLDTGISPVICLNPSHGKRKEGYDYSHIAKQDLDFIRSCLSIT